VADGNTFESRVLTVATGGPFENIVGYLQTADVAEGPF